MIANVTLSFSQVLSRRRCRMAVFSLVPQPFITEVRESSATLPPSTFPASIPSPASLSSLPFLVLSESNDSTRICSLFPIPRTAQRSP